MPPLTEQLLQSDEDLQTMADRLDMSLAELVDAGSDANAVAAMHRLCELADLRTQVVLSRYRLTVAARLLRMTDTESQDAGNELSRRACVELLRAELPRAARTTERRDDRDLDNAIDHIEAMMGTPDENQTPTPSPTDAATDHPPATPGPSPANR